MMRHRLTSTLKDSILVCVVAVLAFSCCGYSNLFVLNDPGKDIRPGVLAVISGGDGDADVKFAECLTDELRKNTTFQVMSQDAIRRKAPGYPVPLIDGAAGKNNDDPFGTFPGNKAKLDAIQKQLKADYIYVVWIQNIKKTIEQTSTFGTTRVMMYQADGRARLLQYPGGRIIAYTEVPGSEHPGLISSKKESDYIESMMKQMALFVRTKFAEVTKSGKEAK